MGRSTLKKSVAVAKAMAIAVGMVIGSDIFLKPGTALENVGGPAMSIAARIAGGTTTLASALSVAEIASAILKSGGLYTYLGELYDERASFLLGQVQMVISCPASTAAQTTAFSIYAAYFTPISGIQQKLLATGVLIFILIMNILSTKYGGIIQTLIMVGKLILIVAITGVDLSSSNFPGLASSSQEVLQGAGFGAAIPGTLWTYDGWTGVTSTAGKLKNPSKTLSRVISTGMLLVIVIHALFNLAISCAPPLDQIVASAMPGTDATNVLFGKGGATFITTGIVVSVFGVLDGYLMTTARAPQAIGEKGQLPFSRVLGAAHLKLRTPANALIFQSLLAPVYISFGTFNILASLLVSALWTFFTMGILGVFILRKGQHSEEGKYRAPLYFITLIIDAAGGTYILISILIDAPSRSVTRFAITLLGLSVYQWMEKKRE